MVMVSMEVCLYIPRSQQQQGAETSSQWNPNTVIMDLTGRESKELIPLLGVECVGNLLGRFSTQPICRKMIVRLVMKKSNLGCSSATLF